MKKILVALLSTVGLFGIAHHAQAADAIKAGTYPSYPPLDMRDPTTSTLTGFDIELGAALSKKMGKPFSWVETNYAELIAATKTGRVDIFFNGMFDTSEREKEIGFVDYLRSGSQFVALATSPNKTPISMCGKRVGISRMTSAPAVLARWNASDCVKQGLPEAIYVPAENSIDARMQMKQGRVDAVMMDSLTVPYIVAQDKTLTMVGDPIEYTNMGIGVAKGETALGKAVAVALQSLIDDGSYAALMTKWNLPTTSALPKVLFNNAPVQ